MKQKKFELKLADVIDAARNMKQSGLIYPTLIKWCPTLSKQLGANIFHCAETVQPVKSFKIRGALNAIMHLTPQQKKKGVICASAGNHAQGTALSATMLGIKSYICMPSNAPLAKIEATKNFGGEVILAPEPSFDAAYALSKKLAKEKGLTEIPPYDHPDVIAGQSTIAYDVLKQLPDLDMIVCPIGGGGLIAGVASYAKMFNPKIQIIGVQAERFPAMKMSFDKKKLISWADGRPTMADGCAVKTPGTITFDIIKDKVDKIVTVSEIDICKAMTILLENGKMISEGAGAMPTAAVMAGKINVKGKKVGLLISGGNADIEKLIHATTVAMYHSGRRFKTILSFNNSKEIKTFIDYLKAHNCVAWTLDTEEPFTVDSKPGTYLLATSGIDAKSVDEVKRHIRKQKCFVKCLDQE